MLLNTMSEGFAIHDGLEVFDPAIKSFLAQSRSAFDVLGDRVIERIWWGAFALMASVASIRKSDLSIGDLFFQSTRFSEKRLVIDAAFDTSAHPHKMRRMDGNG